MSTEPAKRLSDEDYAAIESAVMETARGRWFLAEYARRNRNADTHEVIGAIGRLEKAVEESRAADQAEHVRFDLIDMAGAIARTKAEIAAVKPEGQGGRIDEATIELDAIVRSTETATGDILAAAEHLQEIAWTLREAGMQTAACDIIEQRAADIYTACSFQDITGQRIRKVIQVMRYLEDRLNAMIRIWGAADHPPPLDMRGAGEAVVHGPSLPGQGMEQSDVDAIWEMDVTPAPVAEPPPLAVRPPLPVTSPAPAIAPLPLAVEPGPFPVAESAPLPLAGLPPPAPLAVDRPPSSDASLAALVAKLLPLRAPERPAQIEAPAAMAEPPPLAVQPPPPVVSPAPAAPLPVGPGPLPAAEPAPLPVDEPLPPAPLAVERPPSSDASLAALVAELLPLRAPERPAQIEAPAAMAEPPPLAIQPPLQVAEPAPLPVAEPLRAPPVVQRSPSIDASFAALAVELRPSRAPERFAQIEPPPAPAEPAPALAFELRPSLAAESFSVSPRAGGVADAALPEPPASPFAAPVRPRPPIRAGEEARPAAASRPAPPRVVTLAEIEALPFEERAALFS